MDLRDLWNFGLTAAAGIIAWFVHQWQTEIVRQRDDLMELRENIASNYARKTELLDSERRTGEMFNRVLLSIDRLSDKLDRALERNWQPGSRQEND